MYLILWCIVFLIVVFGINLFLTLRQRQKRIESNKRKAAEAEDEIESVNKEHGESKGCSETTFRARTANNQQQQQNSVISDKSINVIGDDADSVSWIQNVIQWLYCSVHKSPTFTEDYIDVWLTVLNNKSKKLTVQNGVYLEFLRVVRERSTTARLVDVKVESETADNIVTTLKAICDRLVIQVRVASTNNATLRHNSSNNNNGNNQPQPPPQHQQSTTYEIILDKFSALLKVVCLKDKSLFVIRLLERPEAKVQIDNFGNSNEIDDKNPPITSLSPDLIINGILNVLTSTVVDLNFEFISNFPKYLDHLNGGLELPNHHIDNNHHHLPPINRPLERKLFVKIVNASNLYLNQSTKEKGHEIYCTVEVDEPAQCGKTSIVRANPESPEWDQHFMLKLNEKSNEVLFEVFDADRSNPAKVNNNDTGAAQKGRSDLNNNLKLGQDTFLGLGIVSVAELRLNPSQTLTIPLQTRPLEKAIITGDLVVELLLMEHNLQRQTSLSIDESVLPATPTSNSSATTFDHLNGNFNISPISIGNKHDLKFNNLEDFAPDAASFNTTSLDSLSSSLSNTTTLSDDEDDEDSLNSWSDSETIRNYRYSNIKDSCNLKKYTDTELERATLSRSSTFLASVETETEDFEDSILKSTEIVEPLDPDLDLLTKLHLNVNQESQKLIQIIDSSKAILPTMMMDVLKDVSSHNNRHHYRSVESPEPHQTPFTIKPRSKSTKFKSISNLFSGGNRRISRKRPKSLNSGIVEPQSNGLSLSNGKSKHSTLLYSIAPFNHSSQSNSMLESSAISDHNSNSLPVSDDMSNSVSMPAIAPLHDLNYQQTTNGPKSDDATKTNVPAIEVTRPSFDHGRPKFGSFRWLRSASSKAALGGKKFSSVVDRKSNEVPDTAQYPKQTVVLRNGSSAANRRDQNNLADIESNKASNNLNMLRPTLSNIKMDNKRSSIYSQMSFESIDSRLSIIDDSTIIVEDERQSSELKDRRLKVPPPLSLTQSFTSPNSMYGKHSAKSKSDSHLFFCLDYEEDPSKEPNADAENDNNNNNNDDLDKPDEIEHTDLSKYFPDDSQQQAKQKSFIFNDNDCNDPSPLRQTKSVVLKRNTNNRTSLYAKFISTKRSPNDLTRKSSSPDSSIGTQTTTSSTSSSSSIKKRFKFRYSSKVPKLVQQSKQQQQAAVLTTAARPSNSSQTSSINSYKPCSSPPPPSYFITNLSPLNLSPSPDSLSSSIAPHCTARYLLHRTSEPSTVFASRRLSYDSPQSNNSSSSSSSSSPSKYRRKSLSKSISNLFFSTSSTNNYNSHYNSYSVTNPKNYRSTTTNSSSHSPHCESDLGFGDDDDSDSSLLLAGSAYRPISIRRLSSSPTKSSSYISSTISTGAVTTPPISRINSRPNDFHPNCRHSDWIPHAHSSVLLNSALSTSLTTNTANYTDSISQPDLNGKTALSYKLQFDENVSNIVTPEEQFKNTTLPFNASLPSSPESRGSRSKEHHSLIRTIRKRLSFSGKRSKSVERRPTSREGSITEEERTRSVPGSREPSMPKEIPNGKKHQESFSNLSEASTRTFLHDASELIIETTENGNKKHFVVTNPKQNRAKWRRKGIKLHLFNDHLFVARHISGSSSCQVCQKSFARRLGKQGYQCRDCGFMCHKQCHVKVENHCLNSSIASLHLVPIDTDSTDLKKVASSKTASIERNQASTSASQLPATIPELMVTPSPEETSSIENHNNKYGYN